MDEGVERLREAIETAPPGWGVISGHTNLAEALHLVGRSHEALAVLKEQHDLPRDSRAGRAFEWLALSVADVEWDLGNWPAARAAPPPDRTRVGTSEAYAELRLAEIALADGHHDDAELSLDRIRSVVSSSREPQFIGWEGSLRAELERRRGDIPAARSAVDDGLDAIEFCSEDSARIARLAHAGAQIEADAAERARDLGDESAERLAIARAEAFVARAEACSGESRPVEQAQLAAARAALLRARGTPDPEAHAAAARAWLDVERPYPAAIERLLEAQVRVASGDRDGAVETLAGARTAAEELGAAWLLSEIDGLAVRARLTLPGVDAAPAPAPAEDPFGLTPREQQVLALLATGAEPRDRPATLHGREDRERPRLADPRQARRAQPHRGGGGRASPRARGRRAERLNHGGGRTIRHMRVAFLGLGIMGSRMAVHLVRAGHEVTVWTRTPGKAADWAAADGGRAGGLAGGRRRRKPRP